MTQMIAGIEAGGTKFFVVLGDTRGGIIDRVRVDTTTPAETMPQVLAALNRFSESYELAAIGIGCFGPLDPNPESPSFGNITSTPKLEWRDYPILKNVQAEFNVPIGFDTDVNAALLGEAYWGQAVGIKNVVYVTVGTGIGAGVMSEGRVIHGSMHTEVGHMLVPHDKSKDPYEGCCPYHGLCLEGLASGPAIKERWNVKSALDLPPDHEAWDLETDYLAYMVHNLICCYAPEKIILGGGVMGQPQLFPIIQKKTYELINGYIQYCSLSALEKIIVPASLGDNTGVMGALALAYDALQN